MDWSDVALLWAAVLTFGLCRSLLRLARQDALDLLWRSLAFTAGLAALIAAPTMVLHALAG